MKFRRRRLPALAAEHPGIVLSITMPEGPLLIMDSDRLHLLAQMRASREPPSYTVLKFDNGITVSVEAVHLPNLL